jgi:hypothetical protein
VAFERHSHFNAGRVSAEDERSGWPSTSKTKTVAEQSMSSQTPLGTIMEFARS